jgi:hypothetical protein
MSGKRALKAKQLYSSYMYKGQGMEETLEIQLFDSGFKNTKIPLGLRQRYLLAGRVNRILDKKIPHEARMVLLGYKSDWEI